MDSIVLVWNTGMTALVGRPDFKLNPALLEHLAVGQLWKAQFTSFKSTFYTLQQGVGIEPYAALSQAPLQCYRRRLRFQLCVGPGERGATTEIHASPLLERVSVCAGNNPLRRARRAGARSVWGLCPSSPLPLPLAPSSSVPARSVVQPGHRSSPMQALLSSVRPSSYTTDRVTGD